MLAVIPVRDGVLPAGGAEAVAECDGRALLAGSAPDAPTSWPASPRDVRTVELGDFAPDRWAAALAAARRRRRRRAAGLARRSRPRPAAGPPARPAAARRRRPGHARAASAWPAAAGSSCTTSPSHEPVVATLQPGVRGVDAGGRTRHRRGRPPIAAGRRTAGRDADARRGAAARRGDDGPRRGDAHRRRRRRARRRRPLPPARRRRRRARRGDGGDAGDHRPRLGRRTSARSARPASSSTPTLYLAFGISGAVQHTAGLGTPAHIVSVNTDPHCPMMQMADLAIVADANAVLDALEAQPRVAERSEPRLRRRSSSAPGRPGSCAATVLARAGRSRAAARAGPVRRQQEHVRRRRLPAHPRRPAPAVVGGGADPALGHPPLDDGAHRRPRR